MNVIERSKVIYEALKIQARQAHTGTGGHTGRGVVYQSETIEYL